MSKELHAWKFIVERAEDPDHPGLTISGKLAVVISTDAEQAKKWLEAWAAAEGEDASWLRLARVVKIPLDVDGKFVTWVSD
jgi:hypothetical protein